MGLLLVKKIGLLFLLISGSLLSTSLAGRQLKCDCKLSTNLDTTHKDEEVSGKSKMDQKEIGKVHERLLRANAQDYGTYDPTPALVKPPFKLIPN